MKNIRKYNLGKSRDNYHLIIKRKPARFAQRFFGEKEDETL